MIAHIRPYVLAAILAHLALAGVAMAGISFEPGTGPTFPEPPTVAQPVPTNCNFTWGDLIGGAGGCPGVVDDSWFDWAVE